MFYASGSTTSSVPSKGLSAPPPAQESSLPAVQGPASYDVCTVPVHHTVFSPLLSSTYGQLVHDDVNKLSFTQSLKSVAED